MVINLGKILTNAPLLRHERTIGNYKKLQSNLGGDWFLILILDFESITIQYVGPMV